MGPPAGKLVLDPLAAYTSIYIFCANGCKGVAQLRHTVEVICVSPYLTKIANVKQLVCLFSSHTSVVESD